MWLFYLFKSLVCMCLCVFGGRSYLNSEFITLYISTQPLWATPTWKKVPGYLCKVKTGRCDVFCSLSKKEKLKKYYSTIYNWFGIVEQRFI